MAEQKRSHKVLLISAGALAAAAGVPLAFSAFGATTAKCYPSYVYASVASCQTNARFPADVCTSMYREAETETAAVNGFTTLAQCSAIYRVGDCWNMGGAWKPRLAGYRIFDRKGATPPHQADPLFTGTDNKWKTAEGMTIDGDASCRGSPTRTSHYYASPRYFGSPSPTASPAGPNVLRRVFGGTPLGFGPRVAS